MVWQDSIEGGLEIAHGLCNEDGTPKTYYSRSEIRRACEVKGLIPWTDVYTEDRTKDARVRDDWQRSGEAQRAKRDRDEMRRAGIRPTRQAAPPPPSDPRQRAEVRRIAEQIVRAHR